MSKESQVAQFVERGEQLFTAGNYSQARLEYANALQLVPDDANANFHMGQVLEKLQGPRAALLLYQRIANTSPLYAAAQVQLARALLSIDAVDKALATTGQVLVSNPNNAGALLVRARVFARRGDQVRAEQDAQAALRAEPNLLEATVFLSDLALRNGHVDEAIAQLQQALLRSPQQAALQAMLAEALAQQGDVQQALQLLQTCIRVQPQELQHRLRLAAVYTRTGQLDDAENTLREALTALPDSDDARLALVDFMARQRDTTSAEHLLQSYIAQQPRSFALQFGLAALYEREQADDKTKQVYRDIIARDAAGIDGQLARFKFAQWLALHGARDEAELLLNDDAKNNVADSEALLLRARLALDRGAFDRATPDIRAALQVQPKSAVAWRLLSRAQFAQADVSQALESLQKARDANPHDVESLLAYAQLQAQLGQAEAAIGALQIFLKENPAQSAVAEALLQAYVLKPDWKSAMAVAEQIKATSLDPGLGYYYSGWVYQQKKAYAASIKQFEEALRSNPQSYERLAGIVKSYLAQKQPARAAQRIKLILKQFPQLAHAYNLLGEVSLAQKRSDDAQTAFRKALLADARYAPAYRNLAAVRAARGANADAIKIYQEGIFATHGDVSLLFALGAAYERQGDRAQAMQQYESVLAKEPLSFAAMNNLAMLLITDKPDAARLAKAKELANRLRINSNPAYLDTVGWVYYSNGDFAAAVPYLERAAQGLAQVPVVHYHLGAALAKQGDAVAARRHLQEALRRQVEFHGIDDAQATLDLLTKRRGR
ncbi:MAG: tetratricopeptide repeat protein [Gammaproteobacteria bacterium]|nr:tetratricopeptide repeat protein [Gammaproteobacteria bacterium]